MNIPQYTSSQDDELYNDQLSQALIGGLSDNGFTTPQQTTTGITDLSSSMPNGTMWYDTDTNQMKALINGSVKIFQMV